MCLKRLVFLLEMTQAKLDDEDEDDDDEDDGLFISCIDAILQLFTPLARRSILRGLLGLEWHSSTKGSANQVPEKKIHHRVRIAMTKVDHFFEFINRTYFYQDVSYRTKFFKLDIGEIIEMPNVVRTVTWRTMISQYIQFCREEKFEPLSHTTLLKILEVRRASQRKSLQGFDNTAADGSDGFQKKFK